MDRIVFLCVSRQPFCAVIKFGVPPSIESAREEPLHDVLDQPRIAAAAASRGRQRQLETVLVPFGATAFPCALTILLFGDAPCLQPYWTRSHSGSRVPTAISP